jgi:hypothetical protein
MRFTYYLDTETGQPLSQTTGRCDREQSCGYHLTPKEYFDATGTTPDEWKAQRPAQRPTPAKPGRLLFKLVNTTMNRYEHNHLVRWLATLPGWDMARAEQVALLYYVGTGSKAVEGWSIFWQVDHLQQARSGKLIKYDPDTGRRIKDGSYAYDWVHKMLIRAGQLPDDETQWKLDQCLFGLHLIAIDPGRPIAIVESEKTALIASQYLPEYYWLATGQLNGLNVDKLKPLIGRKVVLFPDKGKAHLVWSKFAQSHPLKMQVSTLLETDAPAEHDGYDLADYLMQFDINQFPGAKTPPKPYPESWDTVPTPEPGTPEHDEATALIMREFGAVIDQADTHTTPQNTSTTRKQPFRLSQMEYQ